MAEEYRYHDTIIDYDPLTKVGQRMIVDVDGSTTIVNFQDTSDISRVNHHERMGYSKNQRNGDMVRVASIPLIIQYDLIKRGIWNDPQRMRRWLNSIEGAPWRTNGMRV